MVPFNFFITCNGNVDLPAPLRRWHDLSPFGYPEIPWRAWFPINTCSSFMDSNRSSYIQALCLSPQIYSNHIRIFWILPGSCRQHLSKIKDMDGPTYFHNHLKWCSIKTMAIPVSLWSCLKRDTSSKLSAVFIPAAGSSKNKAWDSLPLHGQSPTFSVCMEENQPLYPYIVK